MAQKRPNKNARHMNSYKIVAYGPEKSCLTWADEDNIEDIKNTLRSDGYDEFMVEEEV